MNFLRNTSKKQHKKVQKVCESRLNLSKFLHLVTDLISLIPFIPTLIPFICVVPSYSLYLYTPHTPHTLAPLTPHTTNTPHSSCICHIPCLFQTLYTLHLSHLILIIPSESYLPVLELEFRNCFWVQKTEFRRRPLQIALPAVAYLNIHILKWVARTRPPPIALPAVACDRKNLKKSHFSTLFLNKSISKQQYCVFLIISNIKTLFVSNI